MNKFIVVSLTLLIVASTASAVVIESPVALMGEDFNFEGFSSRAIIHRNRRQIVEVLRKTPGFAGSDDELKLIAHNLLTFELFESSNVVLGGITHKVVEQGYAI